MLSFLKKNEKNTERRKKKDDIDDEFLAMIQPRGGVMFDDKYIKKGDGYEACIHVYDYPSDVDILWLETIASLQDVVMVTDVATMEKQEVVDAIDKSMVEHQTRFSSAKQKSQEMEAGYSFSEMENLFEKISNQGEVVKLVHVRLFVHDITLHGLEEKVKNVMTDLESRGFRGQILLNETSWEWQSIFLPYEQQLMFPNNREGKGMPAESLAAGLPYHFSELSDPNGSYLGLSFTNGVVLFDLFHRDRRRRFYNGVVVGKMGAGKSTLLKKIAMENSSRNNFIRGFDVTGEFETLVDTLNGYMINLDGSQGIINPLEVFQTVDSRSNKDYNPEVDPQKDDLNSFKQHFSKLKIFYRYASKTTSENEVDEFERLMRSFFESLGFGDGSFMTTRLDSKEYPILEDFLEYVRKVLYKDVENKILRDELSDERSKRLENIELVIDNMVHTYGNLFNGHTTIPDIQSEDVVFFSIRNLTGLDENIFNAQMFNALNMIWNNLLQNGAPQMRQIYEDPDFDEDFARRLLVIIDEAHHLVNADNMLAVDFLTTFAREARKYFGGLLLASQSINDFVPDYASSETVSKIKTLFELTQYKFIMQQDANSLEVLRKIFDGEVSESEISEVPIFEQGDCLLSISGVQNILLTIEASDEELSLFRGGL